MNRAVVITGASVGLGLALSELFIKSGDTVYGLSRTKKHWPGAKARIPSPNFHLLEADVTDEKSVKSALTEILNKANRIDVLINNAGYANPPVRIEDESVKEFQANIQNNLLSVFLMCKYAVPSLRKQNSGWIINISSMAGKRAVPRLAVYSASKFGVVALSQAIAKENDDTQLKCITVCPGGMNTEMRSKLFGKEDAAKQQSPEFVAEKIFEIIEGKIPMNSGEDIVIRHGKITAINQLPPP